MGLLFVDLLISFVPDSSPSVLMHGVCNGVC